MKLEDIDIEKMIGEITDNGLFVYDRINSAACLADEFDISPQDVVKIIKVIESLGYTYPDDNCEYDGTVHFESSIDEVAYHLDCGVVSYRQHQALLEYAARTGKIHSIYKDSLVTHEIHTSIWIKIREYVGMKEHWIVTKRDDFADHLWTYDEFKYST